MNEFESFLKGYPENIHTLVIETRALILDVMPGAIEQFDVPANLIGYGTDRTYKGLVFGIILYPAYINLMLAQGASLADPDGLLRGTGKKARHIQMTRSSDVTEPGVRALLQAALLQKHPGQ